MMSWRGFQQLRHNPAALLRGERTPKQVDTLIAASLGSTGDEATDLVSANAYARADVTLGHNLLLLLMMVAEGLVTVIP